MNIFAKIRRTIGAWAARNQKATLLILALFVVYGYFHFGLEAGSWIVISWRIVTLLLIVLLLFSPFEQVKIVNIETKDGHQTGADGKPGEGKGVKTIRDISGEYDLQNRRDTEKHYNLFLTKLLSIIKKTFAARTAVIYLLDKETNELHLKCIVSDEENTIKDKRYFRNQGIFGKIFGQSEAFLSNERDEVKPLLPYYPGSVGSSSMVAVPVCPEDEINGVLIIDSSEHNAYSEDDVTLVETYAGIIAETVVNYNSLFEFESSTKLFSYFYEISRGLISNLKFEEILDLLLSVMNDIIQYDHLTISEYNTGSNEAKIIRVEGSPNDFSEGTTFPIEEGLNGWIIRKQKPVRIPDLEKDDHFIPRFSAQEKTNFNLRSFLGAPISYHDICFGAIAVESFTPNNYSSGDEKILIMLANNFGVALERSHALKQLELQATTDGLTGLFNYRSFMQRICEEIERAARYKSNFTLLMADIDHFKKVNDSLGHLAGDMVLTEVASSIKKSSRNVDFVCRYGGEEFAVILVETGIQKAMSTAERIRVNIENLNIKYKSSTINVTLSIGAVEFPNSAKDAESLLNDADAALYRAKAKGRNCVVTFRKQAESIL